jgi:hypothetical protein
MSHRPERASDFIVTDARSVFTTWRSLGSLAYLLGARGRNAKHHARATRHAKHIYRRSFALEIIVVGILGGAVLICTAMLMPIVWTAVSEGVFGANLERQRRLPATDSQDGVTINSPGGVIALGRDRPAK